MPDPSQDIADRVAMLLSYGLINRHDKAAAEIMAIGRRGPIAMYAALSALAAMAVCEDGGQQDPGRFVALLVQHNGQPASAADAPPAERFAMQFMAAQANRDVDMTGSLYKAAMKTDPASVADATLILYEAALIASRERITKRKAS